MRIHFAWLSLAMACAAVSPAVAGITVTSFQSTAHANGYAHSPAEYYDTQQVNNVSPAMVSVLDDWTGTNEGGTDPTWHMTASANLQTTTNFDAQGLSATGSGTF